MLCDMSMINDIDIQMLLCECALFYNENENEPAAAADDNDIDYLITVGEEEPSINISAFGSIESIFAEDDDSLLSFDFEEEEEETMQNTEEETIHNIDSIFNDDVSVSTNKDKGEGSASNKHQFGSLDGPYNAVLDHEACLKPIGKTVIFFISPSRYYDR